MIVLSLLLAEWKRCSVAIELLGALGRLTDRAANARDCWEQENETVVRHEERFARIDRAFQLHASEHERAVPIKRKGSSPASSEARDALDTVLGKGSSRRTKKATVEVPAEPAPLEIWIDHTIRDANRKAWGSHYFEFVAVPVVLDISIQIRKPRKPGLPCDVDVFVCLRFATFDDCCELRSREAAYARLPTWRTVLSLQSVPTDAESFAIWTAKNWAVSAFRRAVIVRDGNDPTSEYFDAVKFRGYNESSVEEDEAKLIEAKLAAIRFRWPWCRGSEGS